MQTRPIYTSIEEIKSTLNFDRFTVVDKGPNVNIDSINEFLSHHGILASTRIYIKKQLGIYCLFYLRDRQKALQYLNDYRDFLKGYEDTEEYAEACNLIGHAQIMDDGCQDATEFRKALAIYGELIEQGSATPSVGLGFAFGLRHLGLMLYRNGELSLATQYLTKALELQEAHLSNPVVHADVAESLHTLGVIGVQQNNFEQAEHCLIHAIRCWEVFYRTQGYIHPLSFQTMHSFANLFIRLDSNPLSVPVLEATYQAQVQYYGTTEKADIATTLHLLGDALKTNNVKESLERYLQALEVEAKLYKEDSPAVKATQTAISDVLSLVLKDFPFDWNDCRTIALSEKHLDAVVNTLKVIDEYGLKKEIGVSANEKLAKFYYQLGTYYLHVKNNPKLAFDALMEAKTLKGLDLAWVIAQLALVFQQKMIACNANNTADLAALEVNSKSAQSFLSEVFNAFSDDGDLDHIKLLAFAYYVKAMVIYENRNSTSLDNAIRTLKKALDLYNKYNIYDDQQIRAEGQYIELTQNLPKGYNPKVFQGEPVAKEMLVEPKSSYGLGAGKTG